VDDLKTLCMEFLQTLSLTITTQWTVITESTGLTRTLTGRYHSLFSDLPNSDLQENTSFFTTAMEFHIHQILKWP